MTGNQAQEEFLGLFLEHQDRTRAYLHAIVRDPHAAQDIFQEATMTAWRKFAAYDRARPFGPWLKGIAAYKVLQYFDRMKKKPVMLPPDVIEQLAATPPPDYSMDRLRSALGQCIERLPTRSLELIRMRYRQTLKLREIAGQLNCSLDAANKKLSRIRNVLRDCIARVIQGEHERALQG